MQNHLLMLVTSVFMLMLGNIAATAQQDADGAVVQQQPQPVQRQQAHERSESGIKTRPYSVERRLNREDDGYRGGTRAYGYSTWRRGAMEHLMIGSASMDRA